MERAFEEIRSKTEENFNGEGKPFSNQIQFESTTLAPKSTSNKLHFVFAFSRKKQHVICSLAELGRKENGI